MAVSKIAFYQDDFLNQMRQTGDAPADALIAGIFAEGEAGTWHKLFGRLQKNQDLEGQHVPSALLNFYEKELPFPAWADAAQMELGAKVFRRYAEGILTMLGFLSLPYCYAAAHGAQVLIRSQRIHQDTRRRLLETAQFVLDVMAPEGFLPEGRARASILKVRLMHATVRHHLLQKNDWPTQEWGLPVNQEDMGGTNGAFSWLSLRGLRKMGYVLTEAESTAFLHRWNVIGYLLGVREELLPDTAKEAFWLDQVIARRQFRKSEAGVQLTQALRQCLQADNRQPLPPGFADAYMRHLLGDPIADMLEIPPANWTQALLTPLKIQNLWRSFTGDTWLGAGPLAQQIAEETRQAPVDFALPLGK
ncbi:MAG: oxygenase MpaB family protein [Microscillaceae bacterium]